VPRLPLRQPGRALTVVVAYLAFTALALALGRAASGNVGMLYGGMAACAGLIAVALLAPLPKGQADDPDARPVLRRS
jgi:hypothetical protein